MDTRRDDSNQTQDRHLDIGELDPDPFVEFQTWFSGAREAGIPDANAMILATATADGVPSARTVLLKGTDETGLVFFTNYESHKGRELSENPRAAVVFYWQPLGQQVRVAGTVERVSQEESFAYFSSRHRGSRLGAWASRQSEPLETRQELLSRVEEIDQRYPGDDVPLPPHWGGFRILPQMFEFWESRESRLHDRFRYTRQADGSWTIQRLQP
ncbi:MAG: pyridoxamine 5'-phosphate oxidase [Sphaerobacteraceae bacterium]|nr:MAG: pyridoxamine 5'-phosphate oxidase [Sphaerobacteraceae bacterium]